MEGVEFFIWRPQRNTLDESSPRGGRGCKAQAGDIEIANSMGTSVDLFPEFEAKMVAAGCNRASISAFRSSYGGLAEGGSGLIPETSIEPVESVPRLEDLPAEAGERHSSRLAETAIVKLNGGLGTSMGLERAKSL